MKIAIFLLLIGFGALPEPAKLSPPPPPILAPGEPQTEEAAGTCRVFTVPFGNLYPFGLSPDAVIKSAYREIRINKPEKDPLVREWRKIVAGDDFQKFNGADGGDIRIVLVLDGDTYGFNRAARGYVNGKAVIYGPAVQGWLEKYLIPLAGE